MTSAPVPEQMPIQSTQQPLPLNDAAATTTASAYLSPPSNSFLELLLCLLEHCPSTQLCCDMRRGFYIQDTPLLRELLQDNFDILQYHITLSNNNNEYETCKYRPLALFVNLCSLYFTRVSYCDAGQLREVKSCLHKHELRVSYIFEIPDCLAFGDWHSFTQLKPRAKVYRKGLSAHVDIQRTRNDADNDHTTTLIKRIYAGVHTDNAECLRVIADEIRNEIHIIIAVKRLIRKSLTLYTHIDEHGQTSHPLKTRPQIATLSNELKLHRKHTLTDIFSLSALTQLYNNLYPYTSTMLLLNSLSTSYESVDVNAHGQHIVWLYLDVQLCGQMVKHRVSVNVDDIVGIATLSHPCVTLTQRNLVELVKVLRIASQSPYEEVEVGDVFEELTQTVRLLSSSEDVRWGGVCYHAYNTLLMIYTHLLTVMKSDESGEGAFCSEDANLVTWCTDQLHIAQYQVHEHFEDRFEEMVVDTLVQALDDSEEDDEDDSSEEDNSKETQHSLHSQQNRQPMHSEHNENNHKVAYS